MLLIDCPFCGGRAQTEFAYYGEAHIARPEKPEGLSDAEWADYVFLRTNPKGVHFERWMHIHGCRRFFNMMRDTVSGEIFAAYRIGDKKPDIPAAENAESAKAAPADNDAETATVGKSQKADNGAKAAAAKDGDKKAADGKSTSAAADGDNDNAGGGKSANVQSANVKSGGKSAPAGGDNKNAADDKGTSGGGKTGDKTGGKTGDKKRAGQQ